ncbi:hypothetical protein [Rothia sp. P7208]|uniref:hypothetical protein n=1 Tax=Rothia sp. P7208 TaxID=3402660 RepID=UPI003ACB6029
MSPKYPKQTETPSYTRTLRIRHSVRYLQNRLIYLTSIVGKKFIIFSLFGRLPTYMVALAVLISMGTRTSEITLGAYAAGLITMSSAVMQRTHRRVAQRFGYRSVVCITATLNIPAVAFLMVQTVQFAPNRASGSIPIFLIASALAGATTIPLSAAMRSYWSERYTATQDRRLLNSAIALESMLDVIALPLAAASVGAIAIFSGALSSLYAVIFIDVFAIFFILWFPKAIVTLKFSHPSIETTPITVRNPPPLGALPMLGIACIGTAIGSTQTALVIRGLHSDTLEFVGFYIGMMGTAGACTCVILTVLRLRLGTWQGWLLDAHLLLLVGLILSIPQSQFWITVVLAIYGGLLGASLMCMESIMTAIAARANVGLALSAIQTTYIGGLALGYVWAATVGESLGQQSAMLIPLFAAVLFALLSHVYGAKWRATYEERLPLLEDFDPPSSTTS